MTLKESSPEYANKWSEILSKSFNLAGIQFFIKKIREYSKSVFRH